MAGRQEFTNINAQMAYTCSADMRHVYESHKQKAYTACAWQQQQAQKRQVEKAVLILYICYALMPYRKHEVCK